MSYGRSAGGIIGPSPDKKSKPMADENRSPSRFQIGDLLLDTGAHTLTRNGDEIQLTRLPFALFATLVRHAPKLMTQDELLTEVWGEVVVSDEALKQRLKVLRQAIGDVSDTPRYVASVRGLGYRLIAPVNVLPEEVPLDAGGAEKTASSVTGTSFVRRLQHRPVIVSVFVALLIVGTVGFYYLVYSRNDTQNTEESSASITQIPKQSVAVLPFENFSRDEAYEPFTAGIHDDILTRISKITSLKVTSRTSVMKYRDASRSIREISEELRVATVLEGGVQRAGDRVRINVQLIDAARDEHLWTETFDRELTAQNIFAIQSEIAEKVALKLQATLSSQDQAKLRAVPTRNLEAYSLVLQARYVGHQVTPDSLDKSIALLEQALAIDPDYAAAWAGLARVYINQTGQGLRPIDDGYTLAREAASRALALDPAYTPAHSRLARIAQDYDRDLVAAARHYERALALEPANTDIISSAATMAAFLGRLDQAIELKEYAVARDPVAPNRNMNLGLTYLYAGRLDEAIASFRTTLTLSPGFIGAQYFIGTALLLKGEPESALAAMQKEAFEAYRLIGLVTAHHALGQAAASDAALAELIEKYEKEWAYNIAYVLAFRGEADRAFEWLNKAVAYNDPGLADIATHPLFANIQFDPRWLPFLESIGRSPEQLAVIEFNVTLPD